MTDKKYYDIIYDTKDNPIKIAITPYRQVTKYHYPYEVVSDKENNHYTKLYINKLIGQNASIQNSAFTCKNCNKYWPNICSCPSTEEEHKAITKDWMDQYYSTKKHYWFWTETRKLTSEQKIKAFRYFYDKQAFINYITNL